MSVLIETQDIEKVYKDGGAKTTALSGIFLKVQKGEFVAVIGPSGAGKSTLLHILGFLDRPTKGEYYFEGKRMDTYSESELAKVRNQKMGFVFQAFNLLARTTVFDNVKLPLLYSDVPEKKRDVLVRRAIETVGLSGRSHHKPSQLSGGEKQRVAIARALVNNPSIIFVDEPTGNLDSQLSKQIMGCIAALHTAGHTVILITHDADIAGYAERIIHMKDGRIESDEKIQKRHRTKNRSGGR